MPTARLWGEVSGGKGWLNVYGAASDSAGVVADRIVKGFNDTFQNPDEFIPPAPNQMMLLTDMVLAWDDEFRKTLEIYAEDEDKLSGLRRRLQETPELGCSFAKASAAAAVRPCCWSGWGLLLARTVRRVRHGTRLCVWEATVCLRMRGRRVPAFVCDPRSGMESACVCVYTDCQDADAIEDRMGFGACGRMGDSLRLTRVVAQGTPHLSSRHGSIERDKVAREM